MAIAVHLTFAPLINCSQTIFVPFVAFVVQILCALAPLRKQFRNTVHFFTPPLVFGRAICYAQIASVHSFFDNTYQAFLESMLRFVANGGAPFTQPRLCTPVRRFRA
jgi:hypothetical protein